MEEEYKGEDEPGNEVKVEIEEEIEVEEWEDLEMVCFCGKEIRWANDDVSVESGVLEIPGMKNF